jgi:hypothetical protein
MYSIRWNNSPNGDCTLVGELKAIIALANIFESQKRQYKIADVQGFLISQNQLGMGFYKYWLENDAVFLPRK